MKSSISISQIGALLTHFLHRFHVLVFVLTVVGGLSVATFMLNQTLSSNTDIPNSQSTAVFDQKTMERVKNSAKRRVKLSRLRYRQEGQTRLPAHDTYWLNTASYARYGTTNR